MYPAYNLFLAKSPVFNFADAKKMVDWGQEYIGEPNMYARPTVPLVYTPTDESHYRNIDVHGPNSDSPAWNPAVNGTRYNWGSSLTENFGNANKDSNPFFPGMGHGVTNKTMTIRLPVNKWVMVIQHNAGPMTHPFHIHGTDQFTLARDSIQQFPFALRIPPSATGKQSPHRSRTHRRCRQSQPWSSCLPIRRSKSNGTHFCLPLCPNHQGSCRCPEHQRGQARPQRGVRESSRGIPKQKSKSELGFFVHAS